MLRVFFPKIAVLLMVLGGLSFNSFCSSQKINGMDGFTTVNVRELGIFPQYNKNETPEQKYQRWLKTKTAFEYAIRNKLNLYFPKGVYDVGERNFPFREDDLSVNTLLDCRGITIFGDPRETVLKTSSKRGADVLQLNMLKNITFKNLDITADLLSTLESGSNGISITNGYDNIVLENIYIYNLPGIAKDGYIDGGKGLTMQFSSNRPTVKGSIKAINIKVENSAYGFRFDAANVNELLKENMNLDLDLNIDKVYQGFSMEFGEASENVNPSAKLIVNANVVLKNCQQYIRFSRVIGGNYIFKLERDERYETVVKNRSGKPWTSYDRNVFGFLSNYTKDASVNISGNVGDVDHKLMIGAVGSIVEPFNLKNRTENNFFKFDILGSARINDIKIYHYRGESIHNSTIDISQTTLKKSDIPAEFKTNRNILKFE